MELRGLRWPALAPADDTQGSERGHELQVVGTEGALFDRQGATEPPFGASEIPAARVDGAEASQRDPRFVAVRAEAALEGLERSLKERRCFDVTLGGD
jgi:hypothetical protein